MIKFVEYEAFDEHGQHIVPVNSLYHMNKVASGSYSPELMKVILNMKRRQDRYYVVINALGSYEIWGCNRNGDAFPEIGLTHKSLRTDMGTPNDYGYKTFEYYARLYKHHVNKDPNNSFGEIVFAHWNPVTHRVELIVAINMENGKDIIDALEKQQQVAVSMGCKVKWDRCSICGNKAATREKYCKHLKDYMREVVDKDLSEIWSTETGRRIIPGMQVFAYNDFPRFFDISRVYIGADRTSYILGKAASKGYTAYSADIADALGVTDKMIDKLAIVGKQGEIEKELGGAVSESDIDKPDTDGSVSNIEEMNVIRKALDEKIRHTIAAEPKLPNNLLDSMSASLPLETIFSTLFGLGIHPKPVEFQRIILVKINQKPLADELEENNTVFDYNDDSETTPIELSNSDFSDTLGKALTPFLQERSCFPSMLGPRIRAVIIKTAQLNRNGQPWPETEKKEMRIDPRLAALGGLAALYSGLKLKALGYGAKDLAAIFANKPWLRTLFGGSVMWKIYDEIDKGNIENQALPSATAYANILQNTNLSGHIVKQAARFIKPKFRTDLGNSLGYGLLTSAVALPSAYVANAWNQKSMYEKGVEVFPGANKLTSNPISTAIVGGGGIAAAHYGGTKMIDKIMGPKFVDRAGKVIKSGIKNVLKR